MQDLATGGDHIPELDDVYVDVALVSRAPDPAAASTGPADEAVADGSQRHSFGELLDGQSRVVLALVGRPGSGKSTLLARAARRSARMFAHGRLNRKRVPVLLALRQHAEAIVADPAVSLPDVVRAAVAGKPGREHAGWWERQLEAGHCLILFDGLDEVAREEDRVAVAGWVERQIDTYPRDDFVVTSRSYGDADPLPSQADRYVVRPFTPEQVRVFLDRWYLAAERHATSSSGRAARRAVEERSRDSATRLASLLRENPALQELAVNPLLLTMIATAHRYRGALPGTRADLYGEICQVLLSRRVQAKDMPELVSWPAKQMLLAALAYQMMADHVSALSTGRVLAIIEPQLRRFSSSVTGEVFLDDVARNGLLIESEGRYAFAHLTFQEYLAARHVSANSDLVTSLAGNVSDPWWQETILLYAATADVSVIVRACLDSGTIPALTLAFDCDEAGAEMDPELRERLDRERKRALEPDCSPSHRRLIAGVQAARLTRRTLTTGAGTRVCARPVPADLYWLFLADTRAPRPDSSLDPRADQPAAGIWGSEAQSFVKWLNSITATATGVEVRLPRGDELQEADIASTLGHLLPDVVTSAWTAPELDLWVRPGLPHPHELTGGALRHTVAADTRSTALLPQVLTAAVLDVALGIIRDLDDVRALSGALSGDIAARANSEGRPVDLMHAHARAIALTYAHALELARSDAITRTRAAGLELVRTLDLAPASAMADAIAGDLADVMIRARERAVDLAEAIDQDLSILGAFDFDIGHVVELARVHSAALDPAYARALGIAHSPDFGVAAALRLTGIDNLDWGVALPGVLGLPLRWVADGPLGRTLLGVLPSSASGTASASVSAEGARAGDPYQAFAAALVSQAGIDDTARLRAALGNSLADELRDASASGSDERPGSPGWYQATGLAHLRDAWAPVAATHEPPAPAEAASLRAVALALAESGAADAGVLRAVAATVTAIESRSKGESPAGESVILALV
ncbi:NACHT domain-containing protein [Trebonia kvetii]|uniref:NACHT domain-containing protein n=1 Tax=Trebonia kvetii TaxID=2480626 RepID=UPI001651DF93|nr:NACHT domain-containing protein [Trebonia kvetii]